MSKEIGPREQALRDMREAKYGRSQAAPPRVAKIAKLKSAVAKVAAKKRAKKNKGGKR
jgi:hypothetical protein